MRATCSVPVCDEPVKGRGWCKAHYQRWLDKGTPGDTPVRKKSPGRGCKIEGCGGQHSNHGWCKRHYARWLRTGDPGGLAFRSDPTPLTYTRAHKSVRMQRGPARQQTCSCGSAATQWAYQYNDPDVLVDERGYLFSANVECYAPLCTPCHRALDVAQRENTARVRAIAPGGLLV